MPYSLLNASLLGFDLVRRADGAEIADILLVGLAAGEPAVARAQGSLGPVGEAEREVAVRLVGAHPVAESAARGRPGGTPVETGVPAPGANPEGPARSADPAGPDGPADPDAPADPAGDAAAEAAIALAEALDQLRSLSFGTVADLLRFTRRLPPEAWRGADPGTRSPAAARVADVLHDGVLGVVVKTVPEPGALALADRLDAPFRAFRSLVPEPGARGDWPGADAVAELLAAVAATPAAELRALADERQPAGEWTCHVHDAAWALELTGRVAAAAAAQVDLVRVLHRAGIGAADAVLGTWNVLSGALAVHAVADVTPPSSIAECADPVRAALGLAPLT